jgi:hypothetical protein
MTYVVYEMGEVAGIPSVKKNENGDHISNIAQQYACLQIFNMHIPINTYI